MTRAVVRSRLSRTAFAIRDARDDPWSSRGMTEGPGVFTTPEPLRTLTTNTWPRGHGLATVVPEHGPVRPVVFDATSPLTPLSRNPSSPSRSRTFVRASHACRRGAEHVGRKAEGNAEAIVAAGS